MDRAEGAWDKGTWRWRTTARYQVWRKLELVFAERTSRHSYIPRETARVHRRLPRCAGFVSAIVPALNHLKVLESGFNRI